MSESHKSQEPPGPLFLCSLPPHPLQMLSWAADTGPGKSKYVTERQIHKILYLLALGVQEQSVETEHCVFIEKAANAGVFDQISKLVHDTSNTTFAR